MSGSSFTPSGDPLGAPYDLDSLDLSKRSSSSTYEDLDSSSGARGGVSSLQHSEPKKARFVSDGNININALGVGQGLGNGYSGMPGSAPAHAHHGFSASLGSLAQQQQSLQQHQLKQQQQQQQLSGSYTNPAPSSAGPTQTTNRSLSSNLAGVGGVGYSGGMQPMGNGMVASDPAAYGLSMHAPLDSSNNQGFASTSSPTPSGSPTMQRQAPLQQPQQSQSGANNAGQPLNIAAMLSSQFSNASLGGPNQPINPPGLNSQYMGGPASASVYTGFGAGQYNGNPALTPGMGTFMPNVGMLASGMPAPPQTGRTVYVGGLPEDASVDELLNLVKFGPIESVKLLPEKSCAFISFLDGPTAAAFHADANVKKISLHNQELRIGWGKPAPCPMPVMLAVQQHQATRNVYLGNLEEDVTEQSLRDDLARFGPIDQVKIVRDKNIGFVHFLSISTAIKVVSSLPNEDAWAGKRVNYGKDRCAYIPKSQQQNQAHNNQAAAMGMAAAASLGYPTAFSPVSPAGLAPFPMTPMSVGGMTPMGMGFPPSSAGASTSDDQRSPSGGSMYSPKSGLMSAGANVATMQQFGNRTVYLGNIHPDTTVEEICNHIRGGILQSIRLLSEKHIAFVTFVDPNAALAFYHLATYSGVMIHNRRLKIGFGKHSGPLSPAIAVAVQSGGSRNVYVGNIDDSDKLNEEKLRSDFGEYGEIELVNSLAEKNCAFVNFCNIQNAIKAIEAMKNHEDYQTVKIAYGKDRCGNPPRTMSHPLGSRKPSGPPNPDRSRASQSPEVEARALDDSTSSPSQAEGAPSKLTSPTTSRANLAPLDIQPTPAMAGSVAVEGDDFA